MFRLSFIITCVAVSLASCGGGGGGGGGGSGAAVAAPVSDLGDVCLANESYYPLTSSADEEFRLRKPQPGDNLRFTGELVWPKSRLIDEVEDRDIDRTITWYSVNSPSDVVYRDSPPGAGNGVYPDWGDNLMKALVESNIDSETYTGVWNFPYNGGTSHKVVNSIGEFYAQYYEEGSYLGWGKQEIPFMNEYSSYSFDYLVYSSDYSPVRTGKSDITIDTKRKIKTGIGCVETFKFTERSTELSIYNSGEKRIETKTLYVHPILAVIKSKVVLEYYFSGDSGAQIVAEQELLLMDTNLTYLLSAKTN